MAATDVTQRSSRPSALAWIVTGLALLALRFVLEATLEKPPLDDGALWPPQGRQAPTAPARP